MADANPQPSVLLYGRTAGGDNVPVLVGTDGLLAGGGNPFNQDLNTTDDVTFDAVVATSVTLNSAQVKRVATKALTGAGIHGGVQSWANPEAVSIIITRVVLDRTTKSNGASTLDIGTTAVGATTASDNFLDGVDSGATAAIEDNLGNPGTNGKTRQKLAAGKWVTIKEASGDATGLVANLYVEYHLA
jgi:hypothetical protein